MMGKRSTPMSPMLVVLSVPSTDGETTDYVLVVWDGASGEATVISGDGASFDEHCREMDDFREGHPREPVSAGITTHEMALYDVRESLAATVFSGDVCYGGERLFLAPMHQVTIENFVFN